MIKPIAVVSVQAVLGAHPDVALSVLSNCPDSALGKSVFNGQMLKIEAVAGGEQW